MKTKLLLTAICSLALFASALAQAPGITSGNVYRYAGAPVNGTSEIDTLTIQTSTSGGTFTIAVANSHPTDAISWSATDATLIARIQAALVAHPVIGPGGATVAAGTGTSGIGTYLITLTGRNAASDFPALSIGTNSLTGGAAPTLTTTTAGVAGTFLNAKTGDLLEDSSNGELYQNLSTTVGSPNWQYRGGGWKSGSGGAVTQITSRTTGVTLSKRVGKVTTTADSMAAQAPTTFTVTNTLVAATDNVILTKLSGDVDTFAWVNSVAAGSFTVTLFNSHASAADTTAFAFNFEVRKGAID